MAQHQPGMYRHLDEQGRKKDRGECVQGMRLCVCAPPCWTGSAPASGHAPRMLPPASRCSSVIPATSKLLHAQRWTLDHRQSGPLELNSNSDLAVAGSSNSLPVKLFFRCRPTLSVDVSHISAICPLGQPHRLAIELDLHSHAAIGRFVDEDFTARERHGHGLPIDVRSIHARVALRFQPQPRCSERTEPRPGRWRPAWRPPA